MTLVQRIKSAALALAVLVAFTFAASDAYAGSCKSDRGDQHDRGHGKHDGRGYGKHDDRGRCDRGHYGHRGHDRSSIRVSFRYGSDCGSSTRMVYHSGSYGYGRPDYDRPGYHRSTRIRVRDCEPVRRCEPVHTYRYVETYSTGYWARVYVQPVDEIRYRCCGTPYRVCVQPGYYKRVWVSTHRCR